MKIAHALAALLLIGTFGCKKTETVVTPVPPVVVPPVVETIPKTAGGDEGFLFYNASTGASMFYEISPTSKFLNVVKDFGTRLGTNWSIVMNYQGYLLLYNANTGDAALFDGIKIAYRFGGFGAGFTHLTNLGNGYLACYDTLTGRVVFRVLDANGPTFRTLGNATVAAGYTSVLMGAPYVSPFFVLWYNRTTGGLATGYFNTSTNTYANQASARMNTNSQLYDLYFSYRFWYTPATGQGGTIDAGVTLDKAAITAPAANFPAKSWRLIDSSQDYIVAYGGSDYAIYKIVKGNGTFQAYSSGTNALKTDWTHMTSIQF